MMDWSAIAGNLGPSSILGGVIVSIVLGKLVPISTLRARTEAYEKELARAYKIGEDWQAAALLESKTVNEQASQISELLETGRITHAVLNALPRPTGVGLETTSVPRSDHA
jgi:hypothetical protein